MGKGGYGGGYGGGFGGNQMQQMLKQAQKMQEDLQRKQKELEETEIKGSAQGGLVEVVMLGNKTVKSIKLDPKVVDPNDIEILEDLILIAIKDANDKADELKQELMGGLPGGLGL